MEKRVVNLKMRIHCETPTGQHAAALPLQVIGLIHSPHRRAQGTPIQPRWAPKVRGTVEVLPEFAPGLKDLEGFDRIWLLFWCDRAVPARLLVKPYLDKTLRGVFATRAPARPNPIGLSCVRLVRVDGPVLTVARLDILDRTPLLDIKPYVPEFDAFDAKAIGWLRGRRRRVKSDRRFEAAAPRAGRRHLP